MAPKHQITIEEIQNGKVTQAGMIEIVRCILKGEKRLGLPHFQPSVPFATFEEIARGLGLDARLMGKMLMCSREVTNIQFVNYYDLSDVGAGVALLSWPSLPVEQVEKEAVVNEKELTNEPSRSKIKNRRR